MLIRKPLLHVRLLLQCRTLLTSQWPGLSGAGQTSFPIHPIGSFTDQLDALPK